MPNHEWTFCGVALVALPQGALWLPEALALIVSDLHLGKAERIARREGRLTPPYEARETLARLSEMIARQRPEIVICLGDSFDDGRAAENLDDAARAELATMMAGRRWIWIAGNHDPAPVGFGGEHREELRLNGVVFRHIARPGETSEVSGHYHPKARLRGPSRPAFLTDRDRIIMPAFGAYTGGLSVADAVFDDLMASDALVLMTGRKIIPFPRAELERVSRRLAG